MHRKIKSHLINFHSQKIELLASICTLRLQAAPETTTKTKQQFRNQTKTKFMPVNYNTEVLKTKTKTAKHKRYCPSSKWHIQNSSRQSTMTNQQKPRLPVKLPITIVCYFIPKQHKNKKPRSKSRSVLKSWDNCIRIRPTIILLNRRCH